MCAILQILRQIQRTFFSLRCLYRGPGHNQCTYSYTYSGFNIQLIVSALLLHICRPFSERYTANLVPIQRTASSLRNVNCAPGHIQCVYSTAYSGFNIQLNVSMVILVIYRQFNATYTANFVPNTSLRYLICGPGHIQCNYSSAYWGFNIQLNVSAVLIGDMSTIQWALYLKVGAKYSAQPPVYAMWTVVPDIHNVNTAPRIQDSIFN
jgi:hypothetical protein